MTDHVLRRLLFSNPTWQSGHQTPSTIIRNITALSVSYYRRPVHYSGSRLTCHCLKGELGYSDITRNNLTTLSSNFAPSDKSGTIQGLLYVPDLKSGNPCQNVIDTIVPSNATRQSNLPPSNYNTIALAPWVSKECSAAYLDAAHYDPIRAFIFYLPDSDESPPPPADDDTWQLDGSGAWRDQHKYPVYVVPGAEGARMMHQLSLYSGDMSRVPFGSNVSSIYGLDPHDYVRVWTTLRVTSSSNFPTYWALILAVLGVLLLVFGGTSGLMHIIQSRRRKMLRRRVMDGEVDLEALGIKRLTVPMEHVQKFPLFTYSYDAPPAYTAPESASPIEPVTSSTGPSVTPKLDARTDYQPVCHICLDEFESRVTIIREIRCGHIFHPECIDEFLTDMSSLCPICKKSMLPEGHCPKITNSMVRREIATQRLRPRRSSSPKSTASRWRSSSGGSTSKKSHTTHTSLTQQASPIELPQRAKLVNAAPVRPESDSYRQRMEELAVPVDETTSDDGRPPCMPPSLPIRMESG